jgi:integrase
MDVGLRPGEMFGLHGHRVDWLRGQIAVVDVMTRQGLREYPKSRKSHRVVPVPPATLEGLSVLMAGRPRESLVFTTAGGGPVDDVNFRNRVWLPAVAAAGIRRFPPRIMRHTAASWLVMDGVPPYDVQALLGHESFATTQRYAHLAPDAHSRVIESWSRRRDASVTHATARKGHKMRGEIASDLGGRTWT